MEWGRRIMKQRFGCFVVSVLVRTLFTFFPTRGRLARNHPTYYLLGFSAALAPKFPFFLHLGLLSLTFWVQKLRVSAGVDFLPSTRYK